jgi:hypothetical protein
MVIAPGSSPTQPMAMAAAIKLAELAKYAT